MKDTGGLPDRLEAGEQRLRDHILNPPGPVYRHPEPPSNEFFDRMVAGEQRLKDHIENPQGATFNKMRKVW